MIIFVGMCALIIICGVVLFVIKSANESKKYKYYNAAYKMIKEQCLNHALSKNPQREIGGQRIMVYLEWQDQETNGFVFDPAYGIHIGRDPEKNEICIRENIISANHCKIYLANGGLAIQDYGSINGTYVKHGLWKHRVYGSEYLFSKDQILLGNMKIKVTIFTFDMSNI